MALMETSKEERVYASKLLIVLRAVRHPLRATFNFFELSNED